MQSIATHRSNVLNATIICPDYLLAENPTSLDIHASTKRGTLPWQYPRSYHEGRKSPSRL